MGTPIFAPLNLEPLFYFGRTIKINDAGNAVPIILI
jgi:hypothetical protein